MREYLGILRASGLFRDIDEAALETMLACLGAKTKNAGKDEAVLLAGDKPEYVGVVLSGLLHIIREDYDGNRSLVAAVTPGGIFAEALCCAGVLESPVTVFAGTDSKIMLLRFSRILNICPNSCAFHTALIANMLRLIADKNLTLQSRMEILGQKSIRAKVSRYLAAFAAERGRKFSIPFNREELADFLCVERSALSHELSRMKREGLIDYKKNRFEIFHTLS